MSINWDTRLNPIPAITMALMIIRVSLAICTARKDAVGLADRQRLFHADYPLPRPAAIRGLYAAV